MGTFFTENGCKGDAGTGCVRAKDNGGPCTSGQKLLTQLLVGVGPGSAGGEVGQVSLQAAVKTGDFSKGYFTYTKGIPLMDNPGV
jgi:hypothetical protein